MVEEVLTTELQSHSSTPSAQFDQDQEKDKGAVRSKSDSGRNTKVKSKSAGKSESQSEIEAIMDRIKAEQVSSFSERANRCEPEARSVHRQVEDRI